MIFGVTRIVKRFVAAMEALRPSEYRVGFEQSIDCFYMGGLMSLT